MHFPPGTDPNPSSGRAGGEDVSEGELCRVDTGPEHVVERGNGHVRPGRAVEADDHGGVGDRVAFRHCKEELVCGVQLVGLGVRGEEGVVRENVSLRHFVEQLAGGAGEVEFGVEIEEVVGEVDGEAEEARLEEVAVEGSAIGGAF